MSEMIVDLEFSEAGKFNAQMYLQERKIESKTCLMMPQDTIQNKLYSS